MLKTVATLIQRFEITAAYKFRMDGCKLIIEYEVDCTFEFPDEGTDKSGITILDKETEISKGKIRHSSPDIYL